MSHKKAGREVASKLSEQGRLLRTEENTVLRPGAGEPREEWASLQALLAPGLQTTPQTGGWGRGGGVA